VSKTTLIVNSLILSLSCCLSLSILAYLVKVNLFIPRNSLAILGGILFITLTVGFALYLHKQFGSNTKKKPAVQTILVNDTWLLKH